ncbi:MAG: carbonic anhydrase, partial [Gemmatimonadetes bacterium]|nr:carbonic anhydrase [Gemmatimonadota bacterium]
MTKINDYVRHSRTAAEPSPGLPAAPAHKVAIVTCMDARVDPVAILGIGSGDAHVLRNAGGVITQDVIRSLAMSQNLLGTRDVMVIQHTNCGMSQLDEDA